MYISTAHFPRGNLEAFTDEVLKNDPHGKNVTFPGSQIEMTLLAILGRIPGRKKKFSSRHGLKVPTLLSPR